MSSPRATRKDNRINLCAVTIRVAPEAYGTADVTREFSCVKDGFSVRACKYHEPFVGAGGLVCSEECRWFDCGCTCRRAIAAAGRRARRALMAAIGM